MLDADEVAGKRRAVHLEAMCGTQQVMTASWLVM